MTVINLIYFLNVALSLFAIPVLVISIKNKDKLRNNRLITLTIIYMLYLFVSIMVFPDVLKLGVGLEILFFIPIGFIAEILYLVSLTICLVKRKKLTNISERNTRYKFLVILLLPVILFSCTFIKEAYLIRTSDLILVYKSKGNGGFGDGKTFAYVVTDKHCKEISLGLAVEGYYLERFIIEHNLNNIEIKHNYDISIDSEERNLLIYQDEKLIHKVKINKDYFNIGLEKDILMK